MNHSFESVLYKVVDKTGLNDLFMNQTHPVDKFNSLTEELNHSFVSDLYIS